MKFSSALLSSVAVCLFSSVITAARDIPLSATLEARQKNGGGGGNPETSLTLDKSVINSNFAKNGQEGATEAGQVASLTSKNNYINFCVGKTLTNGQQIKGGSCNSTPMGDIPSATKQPGAKFVSPANMENIAANKAFTVKLAVKNMAMGNFVNPKTNYYSAPQQLNGQGVIIAHSHIVIQEIGSVTSTEVPDPTKFAFFQGLNAAAEGGVVSATVTGGLPAGVYRISSINTNANHSPVVGPVAQRGAYDDAIYITVGGAGGGNGGNGGNGGTKTSSSAPAATTSARNGRGGGRNGNGGGKKLARRFASRDGKARL